MEDILSIFLTQENVQSFAVFVLFWIVEIIFDNVTTAIGCHVKSSVIMDARSAMRPCYILPMFFKIFFMAALIGQTAERIFTKLSHVVDIRCYLRTY